MPMKKTLNSTYIGSLYGERLNQQTLQEEQFDPEYGASRAVRVTSELVLIAKSTANAASGTTEASPVSTAQFEDAILCINVDATPAATVNFKLKTYSPTLGVWFDVPNVSIPAVTAAGPVSVYVQVIGEEVALSWDTAWTGGAVLLATS